MFCGVFFRELILSYDISSTITCCIIHIGVVFDLIEKFWYFELEIVKKIFKKSDLLVREKTCVLFDVSPMVITIVYHQ